MIFLIFPATAYARTTNVLTPRTGSETIVQGGATLDVSNASRGYIMVRYTGSAARAVVRITQPGADQPYDYRIPTDGTWQVLPLTRGNGRYQIAVLENVEGRMFATLISHTINLQLEDTLLPFLYPNQYVNFNPRSTAVARATTLARGINDDLEVVRLIYEYVIGNITYDHEFAAQVTAGAIGSYIPDIDRVLARGKGICFDYAALTAAMLRSQGIPTRLEIGFVSGGVYHAWITVYTPETGWIGVVRFTGGGEWALMDPTFSAGAGAGNAATLANLIGDGTNYNAIFIR